MRVLKRKAYTENDLLTALEDIRNGKRVTQASREYNIPRRTLRDRIAREEKKLKEAALHAGIDRAYIIGRIKEYNQKLALYDDDEEDIL